MRLLRRGGCLATALVILSVLHGSGAQNVTAPTGGSSGGSSCTAIKNCQTCVNPDFKCADCAAGTIPSTDSKKCYKCPEFCKDKSCVAKADKASCSECITKYYVNGDACKRCIGHCDKCTQDSQCTTCSATFRLLGSTSTKFISCFNCESNCIECGDGTDCWKCRDGNPATSNDVGYYLSAANCLACPTQCLKCSSKDTCTQCRNLHKWDANTKTCVACIANCETCDTTAGCTKCKSGWSLSSDKKSCLSCSKCNNCPATGGCGATCEDGYYPHNKDLITCKVCDDSNCAKCTAAGQCTTCKMGYNLVKKSGRNDECVACPGLTSQVACTSCKIINLRSRFFTSATSSCGWCTANCVQCTSATQCTQCAPGYYKVTTNSVDTCLSCDKAMTNCQSCSTATSCTNCKSTYHKVSGSPDSCKLCSSDMANCDTCNSNTNCLGCKTGFYLTDGNPDTCTACNVANCADCGAKDKCTKCKASFYKMAGTKDVCSSCPSPLSSLNSLASCETECGANLVPGKVHWQGCVDCSVQCRTCTPKSDGTTTCTACYDGYAVSSGTCTACTDAQCKKCSVPGTCTECKTNYKLDAALNECFFTNCGQGKGPTAAGGTTCSACHSTCFTCAKANDANRCMSCPSGYYFTDADGDGKGTCTACDSTCSTCAASGGSNCKTCPCGKYLDDQDGDGKGPCSSCNSACVTCSNGTSSGCTSCITGKYALNGECKDCDSSCTSCSGSGTTQCTTCKIGFYLNGGTCTACDPACVECSGAGSNNCTACRVNQYLSGSSCMDCAANCSSCMGTANNCTACRTTEYLNGNTCMDCDRSCLTCTGAGLSACSSCATSDGFTFNSGAKTCTKDGCTFANGCPSHCFNDTLSSCTSCSVNCRTCSGGNSTCTACHSGYVINVNACDRCSETCDTCEGNTTSCLTCRVGFYSNNKACTACDKTCKTCNTTATDCTSCHRGSFLSSSSCTACTAPCKTCSSSGTTCTSCNVGYYLNVNTCSRCHSSCKTCSGSASNKCTGCYDGFVSDGSGGCKACHSSCMTCAGGTAATNCLTCKPGFYDKDNNAATQGTCGSCHPSCKSCSSDAVNKCTACFAGKVVLSNGQCGCHAACKTCQGGTGASNCLLCNDGYVKSGSTSTPGTCSACTNNCAQCSSTTSQCTACPSTHFRSGSTCNACDPSCATCTSSSACATCASGKYIDGSTKKCVSCDSACATCNGAPIKDGSGVVTSTNCKTCSGSGKYLKADGNCDNCPSAGSSDFTQFICGKCPKSVTQARTWRDPCNDCPANCKACTITAQGVKDCSDCNTGYYLTGTSGSRSCTVNSCDKIGTEEECKSCSTTEKPLKWDTRGSDTTCYEIPPNCLGLTAGICSSCASGYILVDAPNGLKACGRCTLTQTQCPQCGMSSRVNYWDTTNSADPICLACPDKCVDCGSDGKCVKCIVGYTPKNDGSVCDQCSTNCKACSSSTVCTTCYSPADGNFNHHALVKTTNSAGAVTAAVCEACPTQCIECSSKVICNVGKCKEGFYRKVETNSANAVTAASCDACSSNCLTCTDQNTCTKCATNYYVNAKACTKCPDFCTACNDNGGCSACKTGYYLNAGKTCTQCSPTECIACSDATTCTACATGHYLDGKTCKACMTGCTSCKDGTTCDELKCSADYCYHSDKTVCVKTSGNCRYCTSTGACIDCKNAMYLELCKKCTDANCLECNDPADKFNVDKCTKCAPGYYESNGDCKVCPCACKTCSSASACIDFRTCSEGTYLDKSLSLTGDTCCKTCNSNCKCSVASNLCSECRLSTYYKDTDNTCKPCSAIHSACVKCSDGKTCTGCSPGFGVSEGTCHPCGSFCTNTCTKTDKCPSCVSALYYKVATNDRCQSCGPQCLNCTSDGKACGACQPAYYLKSGAAGAVTCETCGTGCTACVNGTVCEWCKEGYTRVNGTTTGSVVCQPCPSTGCMKCDGTTTTNVKCTKCSKSYYLDTTDNCKACSSALPSCAECDDYNLDKKLEVGECKKCVGGQYLSDDKKSCKKCEVSQCNRCENKPYQCTKCATNTQLTTDSEKCVPACFECKGTEKECGPTVSDSSVSSNNLLSVKACEKFDTKYTCWYNKTTVTVNNKATVMVWRGCADWPCTASMQSGLCRTVGNVQACLRCCKTHLCNGFDFSAASVALPGVISSLVLALLAMIANL